MKPLSTLLATLVLAAAVAGQSEPKQSTDRALAPKAPFVFEPGAIELRTLIERCGTYLHRNILADESELMATPGPARNRGPRGAAPAAPAEATANGPVVELQLPIVTDRDGCEELLSSLLWARGLAIVPLDEPKAVYEVLSLAGNRAREIQLRAVHRTPEQVLARPTLRQFVVVVYVMKHTNAQYATNALRPFFSAGSNQNAASLTLGNVGNSTSIVLNGPQDLVANALLLLQAADVPQPPELRTEVDVRLEALAKQHEQLVQRLAAVEEKQKSNR